MTKRSLQVDFELSDTKKYYFDIYVKINNLDMLLHRNNFLRYMGGQSHVFCSCHKLPLIISNVKENKCYQIINDVDCKYNNDIHLICLDAKCIAGICKKCFMTFNQDSISYISTPSLLDINNYNPNDELGSNNVIYGNTPIVDKSLNNKCNDIYF